MNRNGAQGMSQILPANGFNNMIDAAIGGQFVNSFRPITFEPVYPMIGAKLFSPRQFFITS